MSISPHPDEMVLETNQHIRIAPQFHVITTCLSDDENTETFAWVVTKTRISVHIWNSFTHASSNVHYLVNPQATNDDVVDRDRDLLPCEVVARSRKLHMDCT